MNHPHQITVRVISFAGAIHHKPSKPNANMIDKPVIDDSRGIVSGPLRMCQEFQAPAILS